MSRRDDADRKGETAMPDGNTIRPMKCCTRRTDTSVSAASGSWARKKCRPLNTAGFHSPHTRIGTAAEVSGAIVGRGCHIGRSAVVGPGSVLGDKTSLTDYTITGGAQAEPRP